EDFVADFLVVGADRGQIAGDGDIDLLRLAGLRIERVDAAKLFIGEHVGAGGERLQVETFVGKNFLHGFGLGVVAEDGDGTVAVGEKVNRVTDPDRRRVVGVFARDFGEFEVAESNDVNGRSLAAAVALPRSLPLHVGNVSEAGTVGRVAAHFGAPHGKNFGHAA